MFICKKIKKNLYGYFCALLSDDKKAYLETHIKNCPSCLREFNQTKALFDLVSKKEQPHPSDEFWQGFTKGLEHRLSAQSQMPKSVIVEKIRQTLELLLQPGYRPILATAFVIIMAASIVLFSAIRNPQSAIRTQTMMLVLSDEEMADDLAILDEFDEEKNPITSEESNDDILDELDILYELDSSLFDTSEG